MRAALGLLFLLAQPFWEARPPEQWTDQEIETLKQASPWGQLVGPSPEVQVYLATAAPIEEAEGIERLRLKRPLAEPDPDYADYLRQNREQAFVVAIRYRDPSRFGSAAEQQRVEEENQMIIGKRTDKILGYFPPTPADPVLRLVFPRRVKSTDKSVRFRLFLPGIPFPERDTEFRVRDLTYQGKLEM